MIPNQKQDILVCKNDQIKAGTAEAKVSFWKSKTVWFAILQFILVRYQPQMDSWVEKNPHSYAAFIGIILICLRYFTAGKIILWNRKNNF